LYVGHGVVRLHAIPTSLYAAVSCYCILLLDDSETYYFISVVDELVDEPLKGVYRVLVLVETAEERPRTLCVFVVLVLGDECERALLDEVRGLVEGVERYPRLEDAE